MKHAEESNFEEVKWGNLIVSAYISQIQLYGEFLRDNDQKRDQFVRFYFSVVLSAAGLSILSLINSSLDKWSLDTSISIIKLVEFILLVVVLFGIITFNLLIRFRILHTYYVKLINRNRGYLFEFLGTQVPSASPYIFKAWKEHLSDEKPYFMQNTGLEQGFAFFCASVNALLVGTIFLLSFAKPISRFLNISDLWVWVLSFIFITSLTLLVQIYWMKRILSSRDRDYKPMITETELHKIVDRLLSM